MAPLSDLSIGFIVGGSVIFASLILGFIVWKIVESKRRSKSNNSNPHTAQPRVEAPPENVAVITHQNDIGSRGRESQYSEIHIDNDYHRTTAQNSADSPKVERHSVPTQDNTDDSGYCEGQGFGGRSEVYSRLHEARNHVENVYGGIVDEDSGQGSYMRMNSASANSEGDNEHDEFPVVTPTSKTSSNHSTSNQDDVEATTISETLAEDDEMYINATYHRVDIIEVHRPAIYDLSEDVGKNPFTEREDESDISGDSDEPSEQDTSL